jgi:tryptophanase
VEADEGALFSFPVDDGRGRALHEDQVIAEREIFQARSRERDQAVALLFGVAVVLERRHAARTIPAPGVGLKSRGVREREAVLERAAYNVLRIEPEDVAVDLLTDVPSFGVFAIDPRAREPELFALAERVFGTAHFVFTGKGRSAERAMAAALELGGRTILVEAPFRTTKKAFTDRGAIIESLDPLEASDGRDAAAILVELSNNALGGRSLSEDRVRALREQCDRRGMLLLADATRLYGDLSVFGCDALIDRGRSMLALFDAYTLSCAKELRTCGAALIGFRDRARADRAEHHAFEEGTLLEPRARRLELAAALSAIAIDADRLFRRRREQLRLLADVLRAKGLEPLLGGHAVYLPLGEADLMIDNRDFALAAELYRRTGVRALPSFTPRLGGTTLRLTWPLDTLADEPLTSAAAAIAAFLTAPRAELQLVERPDSGRAPTALCFEPR